MKITLDTATLTGELFKLLGIVSSKSTMPILSNALLEADADGTLSLHATDLDISVSTEVRADVERPGRIAVRGRDLYDAVKNLRSPTVTLEKEDNLWVQLNAGTVRARLVGMDPADFPNLLRADDATFVTMGIGKLVRMIDRTIFSVSTDEGRPNLTGALLKAEDGVLMMVSTDGHRLSKVEVNVDLGATPSALLEGVIVPRKGLAELRRTVDLTDETLQIGILNSNVVFKHSNTTMFVRLIDGTFPVFRSVVPEEKDARKAVVDRAELMSRIKFVALFSSAKTHNLSLQLEDGTCTISAQDADKGECLEQIPVNYAGASVKAGYNYKYLVDVLSVVDTEQVSVEIIDTLSPTIIHEIAGEPDERSLFIVMPMRL
ncbi:MAG: DNA polymerase III subunit beta [Myxococcales bacterium]|nr:DNA polymerase III subunit beta [Myxococcales bacterium]MCB9534404.1 DNA polymerase III subunit beta [Myxococcales bacterium]